MEAARLQLTSTLGDGGAADQVTLECLSHLDGFTINNVQLLVNQPVKGMRWIGVAMTHVAGGVVTHL